MSRTVLWLTPEKSGGIRSYSEDLFQTLARERSGNFEFKKIFTDRITTASHIKVIVDGILDIRPDLIHIQHEFSLFGSKVPGRYLFPKFVRELRRKVPGVPLVATAHTVLDSQYLYPWRGRGWQMPIRWLANHSVVPHFRKAWLQGSWGNLDAVIVHSELQRDTIFAGGCSRAQVIPHYIPNLQGKYSGMHPVLESIPQDAPVILLFGFFSKDKGQDLAIQAFAKLRKDAHLILAGGPRRGEEKRYYLACRKRVKDLGLESRVSITGFVSSGQMYGIFSRSNLVLCPFRETFGSGSLAQAFAMNAVVLASDLPLNLEVECREPGCLSFFKSESVEDCARKLDELLMNAEVATRQRVAVEKYAKKYSLKKTATAHVDFYRELLGDA